MRKTPPERVLVYCGEALPVDTRGRAAHPEIDMVEYTRSDLFNIRKATDSGTAKDGYALAQMVLAQNGLSIPSYEEALKLLTVTDV